MESNERQKLTKREGDVVSLDCPVKSANDQSAMADISWTKDGRPLDSSTISNIRVCLIEPARECDKRVTHKAYFCDIVAGCMSQSIELFDPIDRPQPAVFLRI